ncbi:MAG: ABC transporter permease [Candidatus Alcyoniella australis]|nr:ABC transporter permease [Candidatus Alcyoniella australis]
MLRPIEALGKALIDMVEQVGQIGIVFLWTLYWLFRPPYRLRLLVRQFDFVGVGSIFIITLSAVFTGAVFSLQSSYAFRMFEANTMIGPTVVLSLTRELGPVLAALMIAGRCGSSMAAELGTMRVTDQIDALESMAVNPIHYLVVPRVVASVVMMPILASLFDFAGTIGSYFVCTNLLGLSAVEFLNDVIYYVDVDDYYNGIIKAGFFGLIISVIGCYKGYYVEGGAAGVGRATTQSVVIASVTVLVSDYFLSALLF